MMLFVVVIIGIGQKLIFVLKSRRNSTQVRNAHRIVGIRLDILVQTWRRVVIIIEDPVGFALDWERV